MCITWIYQYFVRSCAGKTMMTIVSHGIYILSARWTTLGSTFHIWNPGQFESLDSTYITRNFNVIWLQIYVNFSSNMHGIYVHALTWFKTIGAVCETQNFFSPLVNVQEKTNISKFRSAHFYLYPRRLFKKSQVIPGN